MSVEPQTTSPTARLRDPGRPGGTRCSCSVTALHSPAGEILVIRIVGEVDHGSVADVAGIMLVVQAGRRAAQHGTGYCVSGAPRYIRRIWTSLWPEDLRPTAYPRTAAAELAAMTEQAERLDRIRPIEPDDDDRPLADRAHAGDVEAYRELVSRHRRRVYRHALQTLGTSDDPHDVTRDMAPRLHTALAVFCTADR